MESSRFCACSSTFLCVLGKSKMVNAGGFLCRGATDAVRWKPKYGVCLMLWPGM